MRVLGELLALLRTQRQAAVEQCSATVLRRDDTGTLWVHVPGGAEETPVNGTEYASAKPGDVVKLTLAGGGVDVDANGTSPSVGMPDVRAEVAPVAKRVDAVATSVRDADGVARQAAEVANAINQHHWSRAKDEHSDGAGTGAFVTDVPQEEFLRAAANGFEDLSDERPYNNVLLNSLGMLMRSAKTNIVAYTRSATAFFDGLGNDASNVVASFGRSGARIGRASGHHVSVDEHGFVLRRAMSEIINMGRTQDNNAFIGFCDNTSDITGIDKRDDDDWPGVTLSMTAGNSSVADECSEHTYAQLSAQTESKYTALRVYPDHASCLDDMVVEGDLRVVGKYDGSMPATSITGTLATARLPTVPITKGGTGKTSAAEARAALGAASASWTTVASVTGDTGADIDLASYSEVCVVARHGTNYLGSAVLPKAALHATTLRELYLGGWGNNTTTSNRRAVAKMSRERIEPVSIRVDNTDYTDASAVWTVYAR